MPPPSSKKLRTALDGEGDFALIPSSEAVQNEASSYVPHSTEGTAEVFENSDSATPVPQISSAETDSSVSMVLDDSIKSLAQWDPLNEEQPICEVSASYGPKGNAVALEESSSADDVLQGLSFISSSCKTSPTMDHSQLESSGQSSPVKKANNSLSSSGLVHDYVGIHSFGNDRNSGKGSDCESSSEPDNSDDSDSLSEISVYSSAEEGENDSVAACEYSEVSDDDDLEDAIGFNLSCLSDSLSDSEEERDLELDGVLEVHQGESSLKLHGSTHLTQEEGILKVLNLYTENKCTKKCLKDILSTICSLLPEDNNMPRSLFQLFKFVKNVGPTLTEQKHYYCSSCQIYFGIEPVDQCPLCKCDQRCGFFYEFDMSELIKFFFEHRNLADLMDSNSAFLQHCDDGFIRDITDGSVYKTLNSNRSKYDLTLVLNTDGVRLKKSSQKELWLLMVMPVEVPQHSRNSFISIVGVWFDIKPPDMNTFLKPFCLKLREIFQTNGVAWKHPGSGQVYSSQVIAPLFIADAPARAKIQNILNFNGRYGCNTCEVKAVKAAPLPGKRRQRVYSENFEARLRDGRRMLAQGRRATTNGEIVKGVKGLSVMSILVYVDLALLLLPEFMHSVLLGVVKQLAYLWFDKAGPWSCKNHLIEINKFLNNIRPPDFIQRMPRDISALKFWKASEFYYWFLFYSLPALRQFLPEVYYQHYMLLVRAVFTLLQPSISNCQIEESEKLLLLFVQDMKQLYGDREMSYNVHQLLHLGLSVRRWGPLHLTSAFAFEDMNGIVSKTTHGNINLPQEIVINIKIAQGIHILKRAQEKKDKQSAAGTKKAFGVIGRRCMLNLNEEEKALFVSAGVMDTNLSGYTKAFIGESVFTSSMYKTLRTANYHVSWMLPDGTEEYGSIRFFIEYQNSLFIFIDKYLINHVDFLFHTETRKSIKHLLPFLRNSTSTVLRVESKLKLTKVLCVGNFICKQPNSFYQVM